VKVLDLGLAKLYERHRHDSPAIRESNTCFREQQHVSCHFSGQYQ